LSNRASTSQHSTRANGCYADIPFAITASGFAQAANYRWIDRLIGLDDFVISRIQECVEQVPSLAAIRNEVDVVLGIERHE